MRRSVLTVLGALLFALAIYWLGGGEFERGETLAFTVFLGVGIGWVIAAIKGEGDED